VWLILIYIYMCVLTVVYKLGRLGLRLFCGLDGAAVGGGLWLADWWAAAAAYVAY
jgi:hypothetical protein